MQTNQPKIKVDIKTPNAAKTKKRLIFAVTGAVFCLICGMLYSLSLNFKQENNSSSKSTHAQTTKSANQNSKNADKNSQNSNVNNSEAEESENSSFKFAKNTEADIKSSKDKLNVYIFWGDGCPHCKHLAEFLGEKQSEIGDKISLYTFEVWKDKNNLSFLKSFGKFLGENPKGVPYIIIGNKTYSGFSETDEETKQEIIDLIKTEASKTDKIDKYQEYKKSK
jgi:redox-active membrane protein